MTTRYEALVVVLESPLREDDAEGLMGAIRQMRGVIEVRGAESDGTTFVAYFRAWNEIREALVDALLKKKP